MSISRFRRILEKNLGEFWLFEDMKHVFNNVMKVTFEQSFIFPNGEQIKTSNEQESQEDLNNGR